MSVAEKKLFLKKSIIPPPPQQMDSAHQQMIKARKAHYEKILNSHYNFFEIKKKP